MREYARIIVHARTTEGYATRRDAQRKLLAKHARKDTRVVDSRIPAQLSCQSLEFPRDEAVQLVGLCFSGPRDRSPSYRSDDRVPFSPIFLKLPSNPDAISIAELIILPKNQDSPIDRSSGRGGRRVLRWSRDNVETRLDS